MGSDQDLRHLTGARAAATAVSGLALIAAGTGLIVHAFEGLQGWIFLALLGVACLSVGALLSTLPRRLTTRLDDSGVSMGWWLGTRQVAWEEIRRVVIGPLGSGGERDPVTVTLLLRTGEEVLFSTLGRRLPKDHPASARLLEEARTRGLQVDDTLAPPEERKRREREWREARIKGWR